MRIKILILFMFLALGVNAQFALTTDTLKLYRGGELFYLRMSGDTLFLNSDTIVGVSVDNLSAIYDTLGIHLDTLQALRTNVNTNAADISNLNDTVALHLDTLQALRVDVSSNTNNIVSNDSDIGKLQDSVAVHLDSLQAHRVDINKNVDSLAVHRIDIDARNPVVGIDATNLDKVKITFLDGTIEYYSWSHDHAQYELYQEHSYGQIAMTTGDTTNLLTIGVDYLVKGTFMTGCSCEEFVQNADGTLTYTGEGGAFLINGTSDLAVDKACVTNYTLYMDEVSDGTTPHTFLSSAKIENISITGIVELTTGMVLSVRAKSNTTNTTLSISSLNVTFVKI